MAKNNECIYERGTSYQVKIPYYDENGKRTSYTKSFKIKQYGTKQKALEMAKKHRDEIRVKLANDQIVKEKNYTLEEIYQDYTSIHQCTCETRRKYDWIYRQYIITNIDKDILFKNITFKDIQKTLNSMIMEVAQDSISRCFTLWKRLYKYAISSDIIVKDETYKVEVPNSEKVIKKREMTTSFDEVQKQIDNISQRVKNKRNADLFVKAIMIINYTGMRPAECFALDKSSIDFDNNKIYVRQKIGSTSTERHTITKTKTKLSEREFPIPEELILPLHDLINNAEGDYLFVKDNGMLMNGTELANINSKLSNNTFRAYSMRHQFITDGIKSGTDLRTLQELAGHKNSAMTLSYARSNDELKEQAFKNRVFTRKKH